MRMKHSLRGKVIVIVLMCVLFSLASRAKADVSWTEHPGNPVFDPTHKAYYPSVIKIEGTYYMYYHGSDGFIYYTTSSDGIVWAAESPTVVAGNHPWVIKDDLEYKMYYTIGMYDVQMATSPDGITWGNFQDIVIPAASGVTVYGAYSWSVIYNGPGDYEAWGDEGQSGWLIYSTSTDGITWTPVTSRWYVIGTPGEYMYSAYTRPHVLKENGEYHMWFGYSPSPDHNSPWNKAIGYATGTSPTSFTLVETIFTRDDGVAWRDNRTYTPIVIKDGSSYQMWFTGKSSGGNYAIGYATAAPVECVQPPPGLVSWWPGDDDTNDIADSNHGALQGDATFAAGKVGQAFSLDGTGDFVEVPDADNLDLTTQLTLDAWIYMTKADAFQGIVGKYDRSVSPGQASYKLYVRNDNKPAFCLSSDGSTNCNGRLFGSISLPIGQWVHLAATFDSGVQKLYVNGILDENAEQLKTITSIHSGTAPVTIGDFKQAHPTRNFFGGKIDEVEIFNSALDASEIQAIYNAGSAGKCKVAPVIEVGIDIKPGSDPNSINLGEHGLLPVAILGTEDFDVTTIVPGSIEIGGVFLALRGPAKKVQKLAYSYEDVDDPPDGNIDMMMVFFDVWELVDEGVLTAGTTELVLNAILDDGTAIKGTDLVRIVPIS